MRATAVCGSVTVRRYRLKSGTAEVVVKYIAFIEVDVSVYVSSGTTFTAVTEIIVTFCAVTTPKFNEVLAGKVSDEITVSRYCADSVLSRLFYLRRNVKGHLV